jgi:putative endonuclease
LGIGNWELGIACLPFWGPPCGAHPERVALFFCATRRRMAGIYYHTVSVFVYILAHKKNGTLYIGVTSDLKRRIVQHKEALIPGFTQKYHVHMLVYFEVHSDIRDAIRREKQLKKWNRAWKVRLIEQMNPMWNDLFYDL